MTPPPNQTVDRAYRVVLFSSERMNWIGSALASAIMFCPCLCDRNIRLLHFLMIRVIFFDKPLHDRDRILTRTLGD